MNFYFLLINKILNSYSNNYKDNIDHLRFKKEKYKISIPTKINLLNSNGYYHNIQIAQILKEFELTYGEYLNNMVETFDKLEDEVSQYIYIDLILYRFLGNNKVKLETIKDLRDKYINIIDKYYDKNDIILSNDQNLNFYKHKFEYNNYTIQLYLNERGPLNAFYLGQYRINDICVTNDDIVIDCGACYGDTTIEFATRLNNKGKVLCYEFIPKTLEILENNISLNNALKDKIQIVRNACWSESKKKLYYQDNGPGSRVEFEKFEKYEGEVETLSIDDLVYQNKLEKVDFIKMDIEGAEPHALKGAIKTISKYRPKLAISIYHNMNDFSSILPWINSLRLGYVFYIRHFTIHSGETVLYCISK